MSQTKITRIVQLSLILVGICTISACTSDQVVQSEEFNGSSDIYLYAIDTTLPKEDTQQAELILTGDDILWFNQRTREIKFKDFEPTSKEFPPHKKIQFKLGEIVLFEANAYVNALYSQIFTDLVIFHDLEKDAYYLNDYYPPIDAVRDMDQTQANIKAREKNWNLFLNALKAEQRLK